MGLLVHFTSIGARDFVFDAACPRCNKNVGLYPLDEQANTVGLQQPRSHGRKRVPHATLRTEGF